jgi:hypothetical protein
MADGSEPGVLVQSPRGGWPVLVLFGAGPFPQILLFFPQTPPTGLARLVKSRYTPSV